MRCESSVVLPELPGTVFPWLLEADRVPKWMTGLEVYEPLDPPPLQIGSRIRQHLSVSGQQLKFELHITELDAPHRAVLRFEGSGFKAVNEYTVTSANGGSGAAVTWVISGDTTSFKAKLLAPMVQAKLEEKLDTDLVRLRSLLV